VFVVLLKQREELLDPKGLEKLGEQEENLEEEAEEQRVLWYSLVPSKLNFS
jgi:hypothetical protein